MSQHTDEIHGIIHSDHPKQPAVNLHYTLILSSQPTNISMDISLTLHTLEVTRSAQNVNKQTQTSSSVPASDPRRSRADQVDTMGR